MYSNQRWEFHLPINPPGGHYASGDVRLDKVDILNYLRDDGELEFRPRLYEPDLEYDCD